jgi:hypothetical protein
MRLGSWFVAKVSGKRVEVRRVRIEAVHCRMYVSCHTAQLCTLGSKLWITASHWAKLNSIMG